jgi:hypothetical protein
MKTLTPRMGAASLTERRSSIRFSVLTPPEGGQFRALFPVQSLRQALCLELWGIATGGKNFRRCRGCPILFIRGRADQVYCDRSCADRSTVRNYRRRQKRQARSPGRDGEAWRRRQWP